MKRTLLSITLFLFIATVSQGQRALLDEQLQGLYKFTKSYYRSDPFIGEFSGFMKHLLNDPDIASKMTRQKTDTSLYTFFGTYTKYNPFFFTPKRIEILLNEQPIEYGDSIKVRDTIFTYQLLAYVNDDAKGEADIKKEFDKIHRQSSRKFSSNNYNDMKDGEAIKVEFYNYFVPGYDLAPVTLIRGRIKAQGEWVLNITLRFKMSANEAVLATSPYSP